MKIKGALKASAIFLILLLEVSFCGCSSEAEDSRYIKSGVWSYEQSDTAEETVRNALKDLNSSEEIISCTILTVEYDDHLTKVNLQSLVDSELSDKNGFTSAYLESHFAVVSATYDLTYNDSIPHMNDNGVYKCIFYMTQEESTGLWTIWDYLTPYLLNE